jgi:TRAP-type C4-dicarboxylate transport system substrate-binding protein
MNAARRRAGICVVIAIAIMALAAACQGTGNVDKTGGDTTVLRLATFEGQVNDNGQNYGPQAFVDNLRKLSGGRLKVELATDYGGGSAPDAESRVVRAIASGEVDGGWPSTRAFANAGIPGLGVVEAPMTITSYAAEKALVSGPVAGKLLGRLDGTGVVGLGLTVGPLRRPFAAKAPLLGPGDWKGVRFRVFNSPVQADAVRALGATPANLGLSWIDEISAGTLRGAEFDIAQYERSGFATEAGHVTANVVLWPKVYVLALSKKRFDALTAQQQAWVRGAARQAVTASVDATSGQDSLVRTLCDRGVRFADATPGQIQGLRARLRPVLERLAAKPADAQLLRDIQTIASQHPGPETLDVPASCQHAAAAGGSLSSIPRTVSALPDGVYRRELTQQDIAAVGGDPGDHPAGIWTITVRRGTYEVHCRPVPGPGEVCGGSVTDQPLEVGDLRGAGKIVYFVPDAKKLSRLTGCTLPVGLENPSCGPDDPYRVGWALSGDTLVFSNTPGQLQRREDVIGPWRKIA